jgi:hypothetical protein
MLLLLLLAKGWAVTRQEFTWKPLLFGVWILYGVVHILLYVWNKVNKDVNGSNYIMITKMSFRRLLLVQLGTGPVSVQLYLYNYIISIYYNYIKKIKGLA